MKKIAKKRAVKRKFVKDKTACFGKCRKPSRKNKGSKIKKLIGLSKSRKRKR